MTRLRHMLAWRWSARRGRGGNVAIEFAIVGTAFLMLLLGTLEVSYYVFAQIALDYATSSAARALLTGSVTVAGGSSQSAFQSADFCGYLNPLIPCSNVLIVLQPVSNYQTALTGQTAPTGATTVDPGGPGSLMMLEAFYSPGLSLWPLNAATVVSAAAFVNEY